LNRTATKAIARRADELGSWLGDHRPKPGYPAPFHKIVAQTEVNP
jgi:hypothetical protein